MLTKQRITLVRSGILQLSVRFTMRGLFNLGQTSRNEDLKWCSIGFMCFRKPARYSAALSRPSGYAFHSELPKSLCRGLCQVSGRCTFASPLSRSQAAHGGRFEDIIYNCESAESLGCSV